MKSILQNIVLLSALLLIASCDSGVDAGEGAIDPGTPSVTDVGAVNITGTAVKGVISGGTVTVTDASGAAVAIESGGTTGSDGSINIVISSEVAANVTPPITITVTGGTTVCDVDLPGTDDDCGTGVAFGDSVTLPSDFAVRSIRRSLPSGNLQDRSINVNVSPATEIATQLALVSAMNSALMEDDVDSASRSVLSLVQGLTGVTLNDLLIEEVPLFDVTNVDATVGNLPDASLAMTAFAAAMFSEVDPADTNADTLAKVIARIATEATFDTNGNLVMTGATLSRLATNVAAALTTVQARLAAAGVDTTAVELAQQTATANAALYAGLATVTLAPPTVQGEATSLTATRNFVAKLTTVINRVTDTTGAQGFGVGPTETFAAELAASEALTRGPATQAWMQLEEALVAAEATIDAGGTVTNDATSEDGVTFTMTNDADTDATTVTDATSTVTEGDVTVTLTIASGTRTPNSGIVADEVTLETSSAGEVVQTFSGAADATFAAESGNLGLKSLDFTGTIKGAGSPAFGATVSLSGLSGITSAETSGQDVSGSYVTEVTYTDATRTLKVKVWGTIGSTTQSYSVNAGGTMLAGMVTREAGTDVHVISDGVVRLTVTLNSSQTPITLISAVLTSGSGDTIATTGNIDENGLVTYSDGSIQSLPAGVF